MARSKARQPDKSLKRIGIDVTAALTQGGGVGRYTRELIHALTATQKGGTPFHYALFSARPAENAAADARFETRDNLTYHESRFTAQWLYRIWHRLRLPLHIQRFIGQVDLFHSPDFVLPPVHGGIPTLLTVHDLSFVHYPEHFTPALVRFLNHAVPRSVSRATHILADSEATRHDLLQVWDVPAGKVSVLYSGVDRRFHPVENEAEVLRIRRKYSLDGAPYLLSMSTIQPRKNYPMLIRAFRDIAQDWPHTLAIGGGRGWLYEETFAEVERQNLADRVRFLGYVDDADLPALYSGATLFLFPSLYEGFGLPPLEAMACGAPVLISNASSLPEVAGDAARQLPPDDERAWREAMHRLMLDGGRRTQMVAAGFLQARRFTWKGAARQLQELYASLLDSAA